MAAAPRAATVQLGRQWHALHRAAAAVAALASSTDPIESAETRAFPARVDAAVDWRGSLVRQGVADLAAVMEPGLTALIAVHQRGGHPEAPARALLHEFISARDSLLGLIGSMQDE
ncbi:MAG: hypothetical protein KGM17_09845 [Sphingomonadales bacterium]|nr:hypothetical protein [Sphingomonadales bacterium]